jgi:hypothetical protein
MDRMFRVLGFWTGIFAVLFYIGHMNEMALLFFAQTVILIALGYLGLSERVYVYIFCWLLHVIFCWFHVLFRVYPCSKFRTLTYICKNKLLYICKAAVLIAVQKRIVVHFLANRCQRPMSRSDNGFFWEC